MCVDNGKQALEALMVRPFDCLITDIQMPEMDGVEVVSRIRQGEFSGIEPSDAVLTRLGMPERPSVLRGIAPELPNVVLTAHAMSGDRERFFALGMDYYLSEPIIASELAAVPHQVSAVLSGIPAEGA